ncbi:sensor histidine kinase [Dactylosporangium sp. CA-139066]|uniref:sensor histidine kinase n=1 Tax=Dactylosporangium sp. CA-139066 TaxID=3239930 RepID=UPI003D92A8DB
MRRAAASAYSPARTRRAPVRAWDLALAAVLLAAAVLVHATAYDAVAANRAPDPLSYALTAAAVAPVALRRVRPLAVLVACFPGLLALMALHYSVGTAVLGVGVAFYTVAAWDTPRNGRLGVAVLVTGLAATAVLDPIDLSAEGIAVNGAVLLGGWILGSGTRERRERHAAEMLRAQAEAARASAEERLRITRELHDVLGHALSVMVVQAGVAEHLMDSRPEQARRAVAAIAETGRGSLEEMRRMLTVLRDETSPPQEPAPRLATPPRLVERVERAGLAVTLTLDVGGAQLSEGVELAVYRIIQEALTNCFKHARAARAEVRVTHAGGAVEVEVTDDGAGPAAGPGGGQGLAGMRERVAVYRGELDTGPGERGGFRVRARLPVAARVPA